MKSYLCSQKLFAFLVSCLVAQSAFSEGQVSKRELQSSKPKQTVKWPVKVKPYQFIHCFSPVQAVASLDSLSDSNFAQQANSQPLADQYLVDVRKAARHQLYKAQAPMGIKAKQISNFRLVDPNLDSQVKSESVDVQWTSHKLGLSFELVILSTDGELMEGQLVQMKNSSERELKTPLRCEDVALMQQNQ